MVDDNRLTWSIFVAVLFTAVYLETTLPATASTSDFSFVSSIDLMPEVATPSIDHPIQKNSINQASSIKTSKPKVTAPSIDPIPKKPIIIPLSLSIVYPKSNSIASKSIFQFRESYPVQSFIPTRLLQIDTQIITLPKPKRHLQKSHIVQIALDGIQIGEHVATISLIGVNEKVLVSATTSFRYDDTGKDEDEDTRGSKRTPASEPRMNTAKTTLTDDVDSLEKKLNQWNSLDIDIDTERRRKLETALQDKIYRNQRGLGL